MRYARCLCGHVARARLLLSILELLILALKHHALLSVNALELCQLSRLLLTASTKLDQLTLPRHTLRTMRLGLLALSTRQLDLLRAQPEIFGPVMEANRKRAAEASAAAAGM